MADVPELIRMQMAMQRDMDRIRDNLLRPNRANLARRIVAQLLRFFRTNAVDFLVVSYVEGNPLGENLWRRLRFEPVLITATADRKDVEGMLGIAGRHPAPMAYRSSLAGSSKAPMFSTPAV